MLRWRKRTIRRPVAQPKASRAEYLQHKEAARALVHQRLVYFNQFYKLTYHRVSIKDTRTRWGSCSNKGNLNFNYRIVFLPPELQDYLIVHELCHLQELNHGPQFWALVAQQVPAYKSCVAHLRHIEQALYTRGTI